MTATSDDLTVTQSVDQTFAPLSSIDWGSRLQTSTIDVYFAPQGAIVDGYVSAGWVSYEFAQVIAVLSHIETFLNVSFRITSTQAEAEFRLITADFGDPSFVGLMVPPGEPDAGFAAFNYAGYGWDWAYPGTGALEHGGLGYTTIMHELGHGLGLAHPHDTGGSSTIMEGVSAPFDSYGVGDLNQRVFTVMGFNPGWPKGPSGLPTEYPNYGLEGSYGALDIALLQQKYGANTTYAGTDNSYFLPATNGLGTFFQTIWDTGGVDQIVAGSDLGAVIDLRSATLLQEEGGGGFVSYSQGIRGGFTIAYGVVVENAVGGDGNDWINGNRFANSLAGGGGNDLLVGGAGLDLLEGGDGHDEIHGGDGDDDADGGLGDDTIYGGSGADTIVGNTGNDVIDGGDGDDTINADRMFVSGPGDGNDQVNGGSGNDLIQGRYGLDTLAGGLGDDLLYGGDQDDSIRGGEGDDRLWGDKHDDTLIGGNGRDDLCGDTGSDALWGDDIDIGSTYSVSAQVYRLYDGLLNRIPDYGGHAIWTQRIVEGESSLEEACSGFVNSPEFQNVYGGLSNAEFVTLLYQNVLGRDPGPGAQGFINALNTGALTREDVALQFTESQEFINATAVDAHGFIEAGSEAVWVDDVYRMYHATLDRDPDEGGLLGWISQLGDGREFESVASGFLNSPEFQNIYGETTDTEFVILLYNNVLDRTPTQAEVNAWLDLMAGGRSREEVVIGFSNSPEFQNDTDATLNVFVRSLGVYDELIGGTDINVFIGGSLSDEFVFEQVNLGTHTIVDMESWDTLVFDGFVYASRDEARAQMIQSNEDVVFEDQGVTVTIENMLLGNITDDMILV